MRINPHLGIGDLLIAKMMTQHSNVRVTEVNVPLEFIKHHRAQPELYLSFLKKFIPTLWPGASITHNELPPNRVTEFNINKAYIYDALSLPPSRSSISGQYIILHTKVRLDNCMEKFYTVDFPLIKKWVTEFKSDKKIILMGERQIEDNLETRTHKIISIYNILKRLAANNDVVDMSHNILYSGNPDYEKFLEEVHIIHHATHNVCFGIGGAFNMCMAFSESFIGYMSGVSYPEVDRYLELNKQLHTDMTSFVEALYNMA